MDEYNNLVIRNDELPKNVLGGKITIKNDIAVSEAASVSELSEKVIEESGSTSTASVTPKTTLTKSASAQQISTAVSSVTVTASAATIVAAVVVVAAVSAAGVTVPNASVAGANVSYYDGSNVCVEFVLEDEDDEIESFYAWIEDGGGTEIICEITAGNGAYTAEATLLEESVGELYFVVYGSSGDWEGELYRGLLTLPSAPEIVVEYTAEYAAESGELVISYEIYDENNQLGNYTARIFDSDSEVESVADYTANTITATVADTENLYFIIEGEAVNGWSGEIFRERIEISEPDEEEPDDGETPEPTAPDVVVSEVWDEGWYEEGGEIYMYVYFTGDAANVTFSYWFEDDYGNIIACEFVEQTEEYVCVYAAFDGSVDFTLDEKGQLSFVVSAATADGWTGELYREKYVIDPVAPDVEVTNVTVTSYSYDTTLTVQFTAEDINGEISEYDAWYKDADGKISVCELTYDGYVITGTADVSGLDVSGGLILRVYVVTNDGWYGYLNDSDLTLPTAPDVEAEVLTDNMYESYGVIYVDITYTGDTSVISAYEYWFEDEDGNKFVYDLGSVTDGAVSGSAEFSSEDNPALDTYGRMDFVIAVTTTDGWQGEIYREKEEIAYDGYLTYPYIAELEIYNYETEGYVDVIIYGYDPSEVWIALYLTLTDASGEVITLVDLMGDGGTDVEISYINEGGVITCTAAIHTALTPFEDGTVSVNLRADYYNDEGNISDYIVVNDYYTVTTE